MQPRLDFFAAEPKIMKAVLALNHAAETSGLERSLVHLVKLRASQINGCSYCVDMHSREARKDGETEQRVYLVAAWRESPLFSERERAAFAWTEKLTRLADGPVPDELFDEASSQFSAEEMVKLTVLIGMINIWNRLCVGFHAIHPVAEESRAA
ncbi:carboxymuconolactone decarboxylase family protein [Nitratireductor mangrovi]|uniref:Carboxymuconolactone decarboxylase family protein n=1 Tax=Nitratireductor mangrovi TaxID=2599600 RepID=A0A5B8KV57_9HYPH|nr:carboxymuconolactone decarboxylase family protein [Nitratireductor mangrovi]QDY99389.1 carboxymuconolactone decarboxylase family protein [Nitratireductor mangrovi]